MVSERKHIARNTTKELEEKSTLGRRAADAVATFGGGGLDTFITLFMLILIIWISLNSFVLVKYDKIFDPYPYILLNLFLSMPAAIQAPIILMSQNRQAEKDRFNADMIMTLILKPNLKSCCYTEKWTC